MLFVHYKQYILKHLVTIDVVSEIQIAASVEKVFYTLQMPKGK
jgi:hypothetical protein